MSKAQMFVDQLDKVVTKNSSEWLACCPAHDDKSPSLSIKEASDGRILVHCFAGCTAQEVVESVGFNMTHLFPYDQTRNYPSTMPRKAQLTVDQWVIEIAKSHREQGKTLTKKDRERELEAFKRSRQMVGR